MSSKDRKPGGLSYNNEDAMAY
jgi:hypothetical protein